MEVKKEASPKGEVVVAERACERLMFHLIMVI
jgi:hypothetical protein